jgi:hypothetical protein
LFRTDPEGAHPLERLRGSTEGRIPYAGIVLGVLAVAAFWIRFPFSRFNLPCAANWDERANALILLGLDREGLNPHNFHYPTFYYYLNLVALRPLGNLATLLQQARTLNLLFGCAVGVATYWLGSRAFGSKRVGVLAAGLAFFSPILSHSATYVVTDVLVALLVTLALGCMLRFYESARTSAWLAAMLFCGLALSTKYNAFVLVPFYLLLEFWRGPDRTPEAGPHRTRPGTRPAGLLHKGLPPRTVAIVAAAFSVLLLALWGFFPGEYLLSLVQSQQGPSSLIDEEDLSFLRSVSRGALALGGIAGALSIACFLRPASERRIAGVRPWLGVAIVVSTFVIGSPYAVLSWKEFLFDVGYELKANQFAGSGRLGLGYLGLLGRTEGAALLWAAALGLSYAFTRRKQALPLALFLFVGYLPLGLSTRGNERYLTLLLPALYVLAAGGIVGLGEIVRRLAHSALASHVIVAAGIIVLGQQVGAHFVERLPRYRGIDEMHASFDFLLRQPSLGTVYHVGWAPYLELRERGVRLSQEADQWLLSGQLTTALKSADLLLLDRRTDELLDEASRARLQLIWSCDEGYGQYIWRRREAIK